MGPKFDVPMIELFILWVDIVENERVPLKLPILNSASNREVSSRLPTPILIDINAMLCMCPTQCLEGDIMGQIASQVGFEVRKLLKMGLLAGGGLFLILAASFLSAEPMTTFFKILSLAGTGMLLLSVLMMILTFRKVSTVKPGALLVSLSITLLTLSVQMLVSPVLPPMAVGLLAFTAGGMIGFGWSRTRLFFVDANQIRCRGTAWYLAVWAGTFALNQLMGSLASGAPAAVAGSLLVGSGIVLGSTCEQLLRWRRISSGLSDHNRAFGVAA